MKRLALLVMAVGLSGCRIARTLVLPDPLPDRPALATTHTWRLTELTAEASAAGVSGAALVNTDYGPVRDGLTSRLRSTLEAQQALGYTPEGARYNLEVSLRAREAFGIGPAMGAALAVELGVLGLGTLVGGLVGARLDAAGPSSTSTGAILGPTIGMAASLPLALVSAFAFKAGLVRGEYSADLTLRRRSDRVPVAHRKVVSTWEQAHDSLNGPAQVAQGSGAAVPELERAVLAAIRSMLVELDEPLARAR